MSEPGTIQSSIERGYSLTAAHELIRPFCSHSAELDLMALRDRLGPDFNLVDCRAWFRRAPALQRLRPARQHDGLEAGAGRP
ncbi:MAG: hypothetical protein HY834_08825 [Devosia nanyangense]|uniref:Uncharacterized protein n=1 Tax=Devosia nanyangense TaxID=1228055 RepID=A0A933L068_9HYPH|nr:hypothetical protein [Devosia nanyangense]